MQKKITILLLLSMLCCCCLAQPLSNAVRNRVIDQYNYYVVHYSLVAGTQAQIAFNDAFYSYAAKYNIYDTSYDRIKTSIPAYLQKTRALCSEIDSMKLKTDFVAYKDLLPHYLAEFAADERDSSNKHILQYPQLNTFYNKWKIEKREKFAAFKEQLKRHLQSKIKKLAGKKSVNLLSSQNKIFKRMTEWILGHATLVVAGLLVLLWFVAATASGNTNTKIAAVNKKIEKLAEAKSNTNQQLLNARNEDRLQKLEAESFAGVWAAYLELKDHTDKLTARLKLIETKQPATEKKKETTVTLQPITSSTPTDATTQKKIFFPVPDKKTGHFRAVLGKDNISGYTVYQFAIDAKEDKKALFSLIKTPQVEAAVLNFPESYLLHACETEGTPGINKKIETIASGEAQLDGDYWTIQKKALIRYV
jgi:hypothetical protein